MLGSSVLSPDASPDRTGHAPSASISSSMDRRRWSHAPSARMALIREASYQDGAIFADDEDAAADGAGADERSALVSRSRRQSAMSGRSGRSGKSARSGMGRPGDRRSYGSTGEVFAPNMRMTPSIPATGAVGASAPRRASKAGSSRSRSQARTPPKRVKGQREPRASGHGDGDATPPSASEDDEFDDGETTPMARGRDTDSRPLSRNASPVSSRMSRYSTAPSAQNFGAIRGRRASDAMRLGGDSSGDEGGDVARGLAASGGGVMFGGRSGLGMAPGEGLEGLLDPAEELGPQDLELPTDLEGREVRHWAEALRVSTEAA